MYKHIYIYIYIHISIITYRSEYKTKHHPTLTSDKYANDEVLHIISNISNTTFRKNENLQRD